MFLLMNNDLDAKNKLLSRGRTEEILRCENCLSLFIEAWKTDTDTFGFIVYITL